MTLRAFERDRLESSDLDRPALLAPHAKGWQARVAASRTSPELPGTAVRWSGRHYEVVAIEELPAGGVRYRFEPWNDRNVMRRLDHYNEETETSRREERERESRHRKYRVAAYLSALAIGHLPAHVQERLDNEYDISAAALTTISAVPWFLIGIVCVLALVISMVAPVRLLPVSDSVLVAGVYLFAESALRLSRSIHGEPCGSLAGAIVWAIWAKVRGADPR